MNSGNGSMPAFLSLDVAVAGCQCLKLRYSSIGGWMYLGYCCEDTEPL
jgi:hypothetical protein